ncbi:MULTISPECIES: acyl-CoA dehydrogenase family protein [Auritidibacter]|uniref:acyl-CoA dehydrogenase family protein n=1 Tax=Auritidibacter TaxID=1160973 RepID=UPI000D725FF2|nr:MULTISPECIES: acyl-CoA dehydrogenase family protein [Auritidibacter]PXA76545.1 acyl-CoA dehydrogenase [Auritidibacter sp. NML100628]WGH83426.1 acyl-CoA/acyl-ACP dehydrogenase [Auritidibacter ignavus]
MTNLLYTEDETDLRDAVKDALSRHLSSADVADLYDNPQPWHTALWDALAGEIGLAGLLISEDHGGFGGGPREAATVLEELGGAVAPVPFLTSSVLATQVLNHLEAGDALEQLASGEKTAALVLPFSARAGHWSAVEAGSSVTPVAGAWGADLLLVPLASADGVNLHLIEAEQATVEPVTSLDMSRPLATVSGFGEGTVLASGDQAVAAVDFGLRSATALLASEQYGVAYQCLTTTVEYVKTRIQFARPIGSFQAIKHRLADLYLQVTSAQAAARYAAGVLNDADQDLPIATAVAASYNADVAVKAAEEAVQLHGGNGMTWEFPIHLLLKRAKADQLGLGTPGTHREDLAPLVDITL